MNILIIGIDGYIGWSLAMHLAARGDIVSGLDNFARRKNVEEMGSWSVTPILSMQARIRLLRKVHGKDIAFYKGDTTDYGVLVKVLKEQRPDAIVHLGEQPSAPFSMIDAKHATDTQYSNVIGTLNLIHAIHATKADTHLVKLGTMGEYGTPNIDIPEGFFDIEFRGRRDRLPFPRQAGSWYHWSKVHDSGNIMFACRILDLSSTDIMQGVVYGVRMDEMTHDGLATRFDIDEAFGTVINRYCSQAVIGFPLTVYGRGGQERGFIALRDSIKCLTISIDNHPEKGEYRVFNQFDETYTVGDLAHRVKKIGENFGLDVAIRHIENPRIEAQEHYYKPDNSRLWELGFRPSHTLDEELNIIFGVLLKHRERIETKKAVILPNITWKEGRKS